MTSETTLWMGDIELWMNELFIKKAFAEYGFYPKAIKYIKDKKTGVSQNYCFVIFDNASDCINALKNVKGKNIPNATKIFKLNWANNNIEMNKIIYVGNLPPKVRDEELFDFFKSKYSSVIHAIVVTEKDISKKYGFVSFSNEDEYKKCLKEMEGAKFHNNIIKVKERKKKINENEQIGNANLNKNNIYYQKINNVYKIDKNSKNKNINNLNLPIMNFNEIKSFYPKRRKSDGNSPNENDETTFSSQERDNDLSFNSVRCQRRKFSDNIDMIESGDHKNICKKAQDTINKMFEYYKINNKNSEMSNMILYYCSKNENIENNSY